MLDSIALSVGLDDIELAGLISALATAISISLFLLIVSSILVACHYFDEWKEGRNSPVDKAIRRNRHFGGV